MIKIQHRINTIVELLKVPKDYGVEIDIRTNNEGLILHHDPFKEGEDFEDFLMHFNHKFLILNTKTEGMEEKILELLLKHKVINYFFLDLSLPYLVKYMNLGVRNIAVRFSEYEPIEFVRKFAGKLNWVWIDCFNDLILNQKSYLELKKYFKLCLVSPELQKKPIQSINIFKEKLIGMELDAICTKRPDLW